MPYTSKTVCSLQKRYFNSAIIAHFKIHFCSCKHIHRTVYEYIFLLLPVHPSHCLQVHFCSSKYIYHTVYKYIFLPLQVHPSHCLQVHFCFCNTTIAPFTSTFLLLQIHPSHCLHTHTHTHTHTKARALT